MLKVFLISSILFAGSAMAALQGRLRDPLAREGQPVLDHKLQGWTDEQWFSTRLDHFDAENRRWFRLRYWTNEEKYDKENGPIILYVCGEWTCSPPDPNGAAMAYGQTKGGILVSLEHRYYGASQPFADWSTGNLQWLNTTQALEDIHKFINYMKITLDRKMDRKVMIVGGSYPGAVVAWYQHKYNDATMVWSSSGVIHAIEDFKMFDYDIYNATSKSDGCAAMVKNLTDVIDETWATGVTTIIETMLEKFGATNMNVAQGDFMFFIADIFTMGVQYGTRTEMCALITSEDFQSDPLENLAAYGFSKGLSVAQYDAIALQNVTYDVNLNLRQWTYQYCTEFGWYQVPWNANFATRSPSLNLTFWHDYCQRIFSASLPYPAVEETNMEFGGLNNTGKNIYFFNAIEDPWQYAGMREIEDPAKHPDQKAWLINCTDCAHCVDLHTPSADDAQNLVDGRADAIKQLDEWYNAADIVQKKEEEKDMFLV